MRARGMCRDRSREVKRLVAGGASRRIKDTRTSTRRTIRPGALLLSTPPECAAGLFETLAEVLRRGTLNAPNLSDWPADGLGELFVFHALNIMQKEDSSPCFRQCVQGASYAITQLFDRSFLFRRRNFEIRHDVFEPEIFIGLEKVQYLVSESRDLFLRRSFRNILFDMD